MENTRQIGQHKATIKETDKTILVTIFGGPFKGKSKRFTKDKLKTTNPKRVARLALKIFRA